MGVALIAITLLLILAVAGLVAIFVAYPHRGEEIPPTIPQAEWLNDTMVKASERVTGYVEGRRLPSHD